MKSVLLIFIVLCLTKSYAQDTIYWSKDRKLTFEDFKAKVPLGSTFAAISAMNNKLEYKNDTIILKGYFIKSQAWMKIKDNYILNHEQRHFDLYEVGMRIMRKEISNYVFTYNDFQNEWDALIEKLNIKYYKIDSLYDADTNYSINNACQEEWDKYIDQMLKELEEYSSPIIILHFKEE